MALEETKGLHELFEQLHTSNEKSREDSPFRQGVQKLDPYLKVLGVSIGLATPVAGLDPIASNAFGVVQSVVTVGESPENLWILQLIRVASDCYRSMWCRRKVPRRHQAMLDKIPIIERCDNIWDSSQSLKSDILNVRQFLIPRIRIPMFRYDELG
jgi:hypothetical protein